MEKDDDITARIVALMMARPGVFNKLPSEMWGSLAAILDADAANGDGVARITRDSLYDTSPEVRAHMPPPQPPPTPAVLLNGLLTLARTGNLETFRYALRKYASMLDGGGDPQRAVSLYSVMIATVESGQLAILALLLERRPDYERLAWSIALRRGRTRVLDWLRETRSLRSLRKHMETEHAMYLAALDWTNPDAFASVRWLHENGIDDRFHDLWPAVLATQNAEIREYAYTHKIGLEFGIRSSFATIGLSPSHARDPFDEEAEARALETVEWLLDHHGTFAGPLADTLVPAYGYVSVARMLVRLGMTADATALDAALVNGRLSMVKWLVEEEHVALGNSPQHVFCAIESDSPATLAYIIDRGAFIDHVRAQGIATGRNNLTALQQLVDTGVPLDAGLCKLVVQIPSCKASTLQWLIAHGAPYDADELRAAVAQNFSNRDDAYDLAWPKLRAYVATL